MGASQKALRRDSGLDWPSTGSPVKFRIDLQPVTLKVLGWTLGTTGRIILANSAWVQPGLADDAASLLLPVGGML
jgi:hypothetical protein